MAQVGPKQLLSYWRLAWKHAPPTKRFSPIRTIPAVASAIILFFIKRSENPDIPLTDMWPIVAVVPIAAYFGIWLVERVWSFAVEAPVVMDAEGIGVLTRQQERQLNSVRERLAHFQPEEKGILKFVADNGVVDFANIVAAGFPSIGASEALRKAKTYALIVETRRAPIGYIEGTLAPQGLTHVQINPALEHALKKIFDKSSL